jgi:hypothetical protein
MLPGTLARSRRTVGGWWLVRSAYHAERQVTTAAGAIAEAAALACSACSWWRKQNVPIASMALSVHVDLESPLVKQIRAPSRGGMTHLIAAGEFAYSCRMRLRLEPDDVPMVGPQALGKETTGSVVGRGRCVNEARTLDLTVRSGRSRKSPWGSRPLRWRSGLLAGLPARWLWRCRRYSSSRVPLLNVVLETRSSGPYLPTSSNSRLPSPAT